MSVLQVSEDVDYTVGDVFDVTALDFTTAANVIFRANQVDDVQLSRLLAIDGSPGDDNLTFTGGGVDARFFSFSNWSLSDVLILTGAGRSDYISAPQDGVTTVINGLGGNDILVGLSAVTTLNGGRGNDRIYAGAGVVDGGSGVDLYGNLGAAQDVAYDVDISDGGGGRDTGFGVTLAGIEQLSIQASFLADRLAGAGLADTLLGMAGNDVLLGRAGDDSLRGGEGRDTVQGGDGADVLTGDLGADRLAGGAGADRFVFNPLFEIQQGAVATDRITDFEVGRDKIDLYQYFLDPVNVEHNHVVFIGQTAFTAHIAAQLRVTYTATDTMLLIGAHADVGDGVFYRIVLSGILDLTMADFIL